MIDTMASRHKMDNQREIGGDPWPRFILVEKERSRFPTGFDFLPQNAGADLGASIYQCSKQPRKDSAEILRKSYPFCVLLVLQIKLQYVWSILSASASRKDSKASRKPDLPRLWKLDNTLHVKRS